VNKYLVEQRHHSTLVSEMSQICEVPIEEIATS